MWPTWWCRCPDPAAADDTEEATTEDAAGAATAGNTLLEDAAAAAAAAAADGLVFDVAAVAEVWVVLARGRPRPRPVVEVPAFLGDEALVPVVAVALPEASTSIGAAVSAVSAAAAAPSSSFFLLFFFLLLLASPDELDDDPRFLRFIFLRARAATSCACWAALVSSGVGGGAMTDIGRPSADAGAGAMGTGVPGTVGPAAGLGARGYNGRCPGCC